MDAPTTTTLTLDELRAAIEALHKEALDQGRRVKNYGYPQTHYKACALSYKNVLDLLDKAKAA